MSRYLALLALASAVNAGSGATSLAGIKHVVVLMKENRAFDHVFGTMAGVRGFSDPNIPINPANGLPTWYQSLEGVTNKADYILPYYINFLGEADAHNRSQCACAGANNWQQTTEIWNYGRDPIITKWAQIDTPQSMAYFKREDNPFYWALAEAFAIADNYHAGISSNTDPNRAYWQSGAIGQNGSLSAGEGGVYLDDVQTDNQCGKSAVPGETLNCLPLKWPSYGEIIDDAGVDYRCYQNSYNYPTTNDFFWFEKFQDAPTNSSMYERCLTFDGPSGIDAFISDAANGTLPELSWVFSPGAMQEHPPYTMQDGAWFTKNLIEAVMNGPNWNETIFMITYDEAGGWADHVYPLISPEGTQGEWIQDPDGVLGFVPIGPGVRIPLTIVSPYTRGGKVFTEQCDHTSFLFFFEQYLAAKGYTNVTTNMPTQYRRDTMCDLTNAFDFENPDFSIPVLPDVPHPIEENGNIVGLYSAHCTALYGTNCGGSSYTVGFPYGNQTEANTLEFEEGFKKLRGYMTEGRSLVIEANGFALTNPNTTAKQFTATPATANHESINQRWVVSQISKGSTFFNISSAVNSTVNGNWISQHTSLSNSVTGAETYNITYAGQEQYYFVKENGDYLGIKSDGTISFTGKPTAFNIYSVSYHDSFPNRFPLF